ncbi:MAG: hypothetical protein JWN00_4727 [Actinomycetia bacterium]|nr:hypothetical protein [Actinomycetes bacterium]
MTTAPNGLPAREAVTDPVAVIVGLVTAVEQDLDIGVIRDVVSRVAGGRAKRRRLAHVLSGNPGLLATGGPPVPWAVGQLLLGLRAAGAGSIAAPCCGDCRRSITYMISRKGYLICLVCRDTPQTCANCGNQRRVSTRDRHGRPRCEQCPDLDGDPIPQMTQMITQLDPALTSQEVLAALQRTTVRPAVRRRLAWAIIDHPNLLTGAGHQAPAPAVLRFINDLAATESGTILRPACTRCDQVKALSKVLEGQRVCRNCFAKTRAIPCCRCGSVREPAARDADGGPLCPNCLVNDPINLEDCTVCGRRKRVAVRTPDGPLCQNCHQSPILTCGICDRTAPCEISRATGRPWCIRCQHRWMPCSGCRTIAPLRGGTLKEPLCAQCVNPDPDFWDRCPTCRTTWTLRPRPCQRCTLDQRVRRLLGDDTGQIRAELAPLHHALTQVDRPDMAMSWLHRPKVAEILTQIGADTRRPTHEILDELPPSKTLDHLRSVLVATGTLPDRDERLVKLERWTAALLAAPKALTSDVFGTPTPTGTICGGCGNACAERTPATCSASTSAATSLRQPTSWTGSPPAASPSPPAPSPTSTSGSPARPATRTRPATSSDGPSPTGTPATSPSAQSAGKAPPCHSTPTNAGMTPAGSCTTTHSRPPTGSSACCSCTTPKTWAASAASPPATSTPTASRSPSNSATSLSCSPNRSQHSS